MDDEADDNYPSDEIVEDESWRIERDWFLEAAENLLKALSEAVVESEVFRKPLVELTDNLRDKPAGTERVLKDDLAAVEKCTGALGDISEKERATLPPALLSDINAALEDFDLHLATWS